MASVAHPENNTLKNSKGAVRNITSLFKKCKNKEEINPKQR